MYRPPIRVKTCDGFNSTHYDAAVCVIGYEERASFVARNAKFASKRKIAIGYNDTRILKYSENRDWYGAQGYEIEEWPDSDFKKVLRKIIADIEPTGSKLRLLVDISSVNRLRLAAITELLRDHPFHVPIETDFAYSLARYSEPPGFTAINRHVGPVSPYFSGWWTEPERPTATVVGLGYEQDKALGAIEHLQPSEVWAFFPSSPIQEYTGALHKANKSFFQMVESKRVVPYDVHDPYDLFVRLESLVAGVATRCNPILLPFGPKIFALCALLVASLHPGAAVWRVSGAEAPADRVGFATYGLTVTFPPGEPGSRLKDEQLS